MDMFKLIQKFSGDKQFEVHVFPFNSSSDAIAYLEAHPGYAKEEHEILNMSLSYLRTRTLGRHPVETIIIRVNDDV